MREKAYVRVVLLASALTWLGCGGPELGEAGPLSPRATAAPLSSDVQLGCADNYWYAGTPQAGECWVPRYQPTGGPYYWASVIFQIMNQDPAYTYQWTDAYCASNASAYGWCVVDGPNASGIITKKVHVRDGNGTIVKTLQATAYVGIEP